MREWHYMAEEAGMELGNNSKCRGEKVFSLTLLEMTVHADASTLRTIVSCW